MRPRPLFLVAATTAALAGCAVDSTAPRGLASPHSGSASRDAEMHGSPGKGPMDERDSATFTFTIDPHGANVLYMGAHRLELPADAVCQLSASDYGEVSWDAPCRPETGPVTITAQVKGTSTGYPRIDFEPALRFNPRTSVYLSLFVKRPSTADPLGWRVLYCANASQVDCIDEAVMDPDLATETNWPVPLLTRRIKHFSGYMVAE